MRSEQSRRGSLRDERGAGLPGIRRRCAVGRPNGESAKHAATIVTWKGGPPRACPVPAGGDTRPSATGACGARPVMIESAPLAAGKLAPAACGRSRSSVKRSVTRAFNLNYQRLSATMLDTPQFKPMGAREWPDTECGRRVDITATILSERIRLGLAQAVLGQDAPREHR